MTTIVRITPNIVMSVFKFLKDTSYTVGSTTGKLTDHFSGLKIVQAYPDDLTKLSAPTLALTETTDIAQAQHFYGQSLAEDIYRLSVYGFVMGQGDDIRNKAYRDRLMNDVYQLLSSVGQNEGIPLYDHVTKAEIGAIETMEVRARTIPVNAPEIEADRYKFVAECEIPHIGASIPG